MENQITKKQSVFWKRSLLIQYSFYFCVLCVCIFGWYFFTGRHFIYDGDGKNQHYLAYMYIGQWLRKIVRNIFVYRTFVIPQIDLNIGLGSDIIKTLHYYGLGDPFLLLSVFVPSAKTGAFFDFCGLLRLYAAGIVFIFLCFEFGKSSKTGILAGTFVYVFYHWAIYNVARHPFFLNPMIYFPLLIIGFERILKNKGFICFIVAVPLFALSNFYFFYMGVIFIILYAALRSFEFYGKNFRQILKVAAKCFGCAILGLCMAAFILLPVIAAFLQDARNGGTKFYMLYKAEYYKLLPSVFLTIQSEYWLTLGFSVMSVPALYALFKERGDKLLKIFLGICLLIVCIPFLGQIINGFSYRSNRWNWAFALLVAYILVEKWDSICNFKLKDCIVCFLICGSFMLYAFVAKQQKNIRPFNFNNLIQQVLILVIFTVITTGFALCENYKGENVKVHHRAIFRYKESAILLICTVSIILNATYKFSPQKGKYVNTGLTDKDLAFVKNGEAAKVKAFKAKRKDKNFYRYSAEHMVRNASMVANVPSTGYYWSLSNPNISDFFYDIEQAQGTMYNYEGFEKRSSILSLACVKYFYGKDGIKPRGFVATENADIFENKNVLPFGYAYESCMSLAEWKKLSALEKQEALTYSAVLEEVPDGLTKADYKTTVRKVPFELDFGDDVQEIREEAPEHAGASRMDASAEAKTDFKGFFIQKKNATATLNFEPLSDCELYLRIGNLHFDLPKDSAKENRSAKKNLPARVELSFRLSDGSSKKLMYATPEFTWYHNQHDFTIHLPYRANTVNSIIIKFVTPGVYTFDDVSVFALPMAKMEKNLNELKQCTLQDVKFSQNKIEGKITSEKSRVLLIPMAYERGWRAKINGKRTKVLRANEMFCALVLEPGENSILLKYRSPLFYEGIVLAVLQLWCLFGFVFGVGVLLKTHKIILRTMGIWRRIAVNASPITKTVLQ